MRVTEGGGLAGLNGQAPGAARLHLADGVALLRPGEQVFRAMLAGFTNQQLARNLARHDGGGPGEHGAGVRRLYVNAYPWHWTAASGGWVASGICARCVT